MTSPLVLHIVRTQVSEGQVESVDTAGADSVDGVELTLTAVKLPVGLTLNGQPLLADARIRFQGQEVAAVVARDPYIATDAAELIDVDIASTAESPVQADDASLEAAKIEIRQPRWHVAPLQLQSCLAVPNADGSIDVHVMARDSESFEVALTTASGLPPGVIKVHPDAAEGRAVTDADLVVAGHVLTVLAAKELSRPVVWRETRAESLTSGGAQAGFVAHGTITGTPDAGDCQLAVRLAVDIGAYALDGTTEEHRAWQSLDWYDFADLVVESVQRESNLPPSSAAGAETLGVVFVADAAIEELAGDWGISRDAVQTNLLERAPESVRTLFETAQLRSSIGDPGAATATVLAPGMAAGVEVSVDPSTFEWRVQQVRLAVGFDASPAVRRALTAGAQDGFGIAAMQEISFDEQGTCLAATLMDYVMPSAWEAPLVEIAAASGPATVNPDTARRLASAAVAQAARRALASHLRTPPGTAAMVTPSVLWAAAT